MNVKYKTKSIANPYPQRKHLSERYMCNRNLLQADSSFKGSSLSKFADIYEFAPIAYLVLNANGEIANANLASAKLLGLDHNNLLRQRFESFVAKRYKHLWHQQFMDSLKHPEHIDAEFEFVLNRADGKQLHIRCICECFVCPKGLPELFLVLIDNTQFKNIENDLRIAAATFESFDGIAIINTQKNILKVNQTFTKITGYSNEDAIGRTLQQICLGAHSSAFDPVIWNSVNRTGKWQGQVWNQYKNGEIYPHWLSINTTISEDITIPFYYIAKLSNGTLLDSSFEQIEYKAFHDPLTNLPNRLLLKEHLQQALAASKRNKRQGALMFIDLDNFKTLNDTYGHYAGDQVLQQVAQRLLHSIRKGDTAARLGGDEFVVMLNELSEDPEEAVLQSKITGQKILAALNKPYQLSGCEYLCSSSIGVSLFGDYSTTEEDLIGCADIAMYHAKTAGRNKLRFFDQTLQALLIAQTKMETELRSALNHHQFILHFQIQSAPGKQIKAAEVLLRWQHPVRGRMLAQDFMPIAEKTGLILPMDQWVIKTVCDLLKKWENNAFARQIQLAVNISDRYFHQAYFVQQIKDVLEKTDIIPGRLTLELSERITSDSAVDCTQKIQALNDLGVNTCLNKFGIGEAPLSILTNLPFRQFKIDRSLVESIGPATHNEALLTHAIIEIGNRLGIDVIANGVETENQKNKLANFGCQYFQGNWIAKPMTDDDLERLLESKSHKPA